LLRERVNHGASLRAFFAAVGMAVNTNTPRLRLMTNRMKYRLLVFLQIGEISGKGLVHVSLVKTCLCRQAHNDGGLCALFIFGAMMIIFTTATKA